MASTRHQRLQESLKVQEFYTQAEKEDAWMRIKEQLCLQSDTRKDVRTVLSKYSAFVNVLYHCIDVTYIHSYICMYV